MTGPAVAGPNVFPLTCREKNRAARWVSVKISGTGHYLSLEYLWRN